MGFSRNLPYQGNYPGPLFYYSLNAASMIPNLIFATYFTGDSDQSFAQIGAYDTTGTYYTGSLVWLSVS